MAVSRLFIYRFLAWCQRGSKAVWDPMELEVQMVGCELGTEARSSEEQPMLLAAESPLHLTYSPRVLTVAPVIPGLPETSCLAPSVRLTVLPALTFQQGSAGLFVDPLGF